MARFAFSALSTLALALAGLITWEVQPTTQSAPPNSAFPARPGASVQTHPPNPDQTQTWVETTLARPLFSPGRRPSLVAPRLVGMLVSPSARLAIFIVAEGARPNLAAEGSMVGPYKVKSIETGRVTVIDRDGTYSLRPDYATTSKPVEPEITCALYDADFRGLDSGWNFGPSCLDVIRVLQSSGGSLSKP
jgi:hypothetical protein